MRSLLLAYACVCVSACNFNSTGNTAGNTAGDSSSSTGGATGDPATGDPPDPTTTAVGDVCVPGTPAPCECTFGMGEHLCNPDGEGYGPCMDCPPDPTQGTDTGDTGSTSSVDPGTTTMVDPSTSSSTNDPSTTSGESSTTSDDTTSGSSSTNDPSTTTGDPSTTTGDNLNGPCPGGMNNECEQGEICIDGSVMMAGMWSLCTQGTCSNDNQCDPPHDVCADAPGDGEGDKFCLQSCDMQNPCPMGMECFPGFMMNPDVCLWPKP